jgi:Xaa-Pro dipeptidase
MSDRIEMFQERVRASGIDLMVLNPGPSLTYLTGHGFDSHERLFLLFVPAEGTPGAILPLLEQDNWSASVPAVDKVWLWDDKDGPEAAAAAAAAEYAGAGTVGVEPLGLRYMEYDVLRRHMPGAEVVSGAAIVDSMRQFKDAEEAGSMRRAAEIAEEALEETVQLVRVGMTEKQIAAELVSRMLGKGGEGISFGPIVLGGPKSALPHGVPDERPLGAGEYLLIDFGTSYRGYHCDITRTFVVGGEPDDRQRAVYEAVRAGNEAGCARATVGTSSHDVHMAAQAPLMAPEFADYFKHRTGHGLGLDIHEPPSVMEGNHEPLGEGSVITVEPGLYMEGWGGVRIEDDIWVTADGPDSLTSYARELRVIGT